MCSIQHGRVICLSLISSSHPANLSSGLLASLLRISQHLILGLVHCLCLSLFVVAGGVCVNLHRQTDCNLILVMQLGNYFITWFKWLLMHCNVTVSVSNDCLSEAVFMQTVCLFSFRCVLAVSSALVDNRGRNGQRHLTTQVSSYCKTWAPIYWLDNKEKKRKL